MKRAKPVYLNAKRIGVWKEESHGMDRGTVTRFRIPLLTKGAFAPRGGHIKLPGVLITWNDGPNPTWAKKRVVRLFKAISFLHEDDKKGTLKATHPGLRVRSFTLSRPVLRPATTY